MEFLYQRFAQCKSANIENNTKIGKVRQLLQPSPCSPHPTSFPTLLHTLPSVPHTLSEICSNKTSDKQGEGRLKVGSPIVCDNPNIEQDIGPKILPCVLETVFCKRSKKRSVRCSVWCLIQCSESPHFIRLVLINIDLPSFPSPCLVWCLDWASILCKMSTLWNSLPHLRPPSS